MASRGRIERTLALAIVLTAMIPLLAAVYLANKAVRDTSERFFLPEIGARLDESLGLYQELARAEKSAMRSEAREIAASPELTAAIAGLDTAALQKALDGALGKRPNLVSLTVVLGDRKLASAERGKPVDPEHELTLEVRQPIGIREVKDDAEDDDGPTLVAVLATSNARYGGRDRMSEFVSAYNTMAARRKGDERAYLLAFSVLLGITIVGAIGVGTLLARGVATRIVRLAEATRRVGKGDLSTRVDEAGADEVADLGRAFNRMLAEIETTRARIEYLQRIGAWQEMARRLAHEIKNPLTPIQLAVEEIHQRYGGGDQQYRKLLDATLEVVQAEVGTLRRLVGEFSDFARLPQAHLERGDLRKFLAEQVDQSLVLEGGTAEPGAAEKPASRIVVSFELPDFDAPVNLDPQMLRRAFINLVRNSAQAVRDQGRKEGKVRVTLGRSGEFWIVDVDDDGPGVAPGDRERIFDPYVTTKHDGTGLGLAIVKKIVVEHGGTITAQESPFGGARMRVTIPAGGTAAAAAARDAGEGSQKLASPGEIAARNEGA